MEEFSVEAAWSGSVVSAEAPAEGAVLDRRTLNRTLLVRQRLLGRVGLPAAAMLEHLVGLQAQVPRDPYVALWSRIHAFDPLDLDRLVADRAAVRMTLMRTTLHLVTARDTFLLRGPIQDVCERRFRSSPFARRLAGVDLAAVVAVGADVLAARPHTVAELGPALGERWPGVDAEALAYAVRYLVPLVQVPPRGRWRLSGPPRLTTLAAWLGTATETLPTDPAAVVLRYLRAFGPATVADVRAWSGLSRVAEVLARLRPELRTYRDERGRELFDVADGEFASGSEPAPVRFTGEYDNLFLAHADRSRITGDSTWGESYVRRGAFFVDGFLAGAWRLDEKSAVSGISLEPRGTLSVSDRDAVAAEAEALARFLLPEAGSPAIHWAVA